MPARAGDVTKIYLAKQSIPNSSYPAVTSSFFVDSVFDTPVGLLVLLYAITQGALPSLDLLPSLPAFDLAFWADHPRFFLFTMTFLTIALLLLYAVLSVRAVDFWQRIKQGVVILTDFGRYLRQVASWMAAGWLFRFGAFWFFLEAFNIGGSVQNVLFMMGVQALSTLTPFTPGGAGAQQALLVYAFSDVASRSTVLAYSVGQQIAMAVFNVTVSLVVIFLMASDAEPAARDPSWRGGEETGEWRGRGIGRAGGGGAAGAALGEALARLAHERHGLGEQHADGVAHLSGLLRPRCRRGPGSGSPPRSCPRRA